MLSPLPLTPQPEQQLLSIEEAYRRCLTYVVRVEETFRQTHDGRMPHLTHQEDFDTIVLAASPWAESMSLGSARSAIGQQITHYDFALALFRSFVERTVPVPADFQRYQSELWDGVLGRLFYNPPAREYAFRIERLQGIPERVDFGSIRNLLSLTAAQAESVRACEALSAERNKGCKDAFANPCNQLQRLTAVCVEYTAPKINLREVLTNQLSRALEVSRSFPGQHPGSRWHYR